MAAGANAVTQMSLMAWPEHIFPRTAETPGYCKKSWYREKSWYCGGSEGKCKKKYLWLRSYSTGCTSSTWNCTSPAAKVSTSCRVLLTDNYGNNNLYNNFQHVVLAPSHCLLDFRLQGKSHMHVHASHMIVHTAWRCCIDASWWSFTCTSLTSTRCVMSAQNQHSDERHWSMLTSGPTGST